MEWKEYKLKEVCSRLSSGKSIKASEVFSQGEFPVYGGNGLRGYCSSCNFEGECGIIGRQGAYCGNVRYFSGKAYMTEHAVVVQANELANTYYLATLLSTMHLEQLSGQSAQPGLAVGTLAVQTIKLPPLPEQKRIAAILSSLDDKIENNRKINKNLEEQAQALFKSWFVDFEPFKDGEFVESELGMIPKGWRVGSLEDYATVSKRSIAPNKYPEVLFHHYSLPAFDEGRVPALQLGSEIMSNKLLVESKTTLISKLNPHIKRVWFVDDVEENPICSTEFIPISSKETNSAGFVFCCVNDSSFYCQAVSGVNGATTSHQRIHPEDVMTTKIAVDDVTVSRFSQIIYPLLHSIEANIQESRRLAQLRDTLLPKLMNGEIEI